MIGKFGLRAPLLALLVLALPWPSAAEGPGTVPETLEHEGFQGVIARAGNTYISGQPTADGLAWAKKQGVITVVNLRTQREMDNRNRVPYDEAAKAKELGLAYVHIPLGGDDTPYTPAAVDAFAKAVENADGKVLLHCTIAWRASHMWAAYLVKHKGMSVDEAITNAKAINFGGLPLADLLDKELTLKDKK